MEEQCWKLVPVYRRSLSRQHKESMGEQDRHQAWPFGECPPPLQTASKPGCCIHQNFFFFPFGSDGSGGESGSSSNGRFGGCDGAVCGDSDVTGLNG